MVYYIINIDLAISRILRRCFLVSWSRCRFMHRSFYQIFVLALLLVPRWYLPGKDAPFGSRRPGELHYMPEVISKRGGRAGVVCCV